MSITLYTTHCPRCKILETKLQQSGLEYAVCEDFDTMVQLGISSAPMLGVDTELLDFNRAINFLKNLKEN